MQRGQVVLAHIVEALVHLLLQLFGRLNDNRLKVTGQLLSIGVCGFLLVDQTVLESLSVFTNDCKFLLE